LALNIKKEGGEIMAVWKCQSCGTDLEGRCKPGKCKSCGAPKDSLEKQEQEKKKIFRNTIMEIRNTTIIQMKLNQ